MSALDTSADAVEALARRLGGVPLDMTVDEFDEAAALLRALLRERDEARAEIAAREAAAALAMREMAVDDRSKLAKLIEDFYAPWGAWKTVWWEGEVGDCKPFGPDNLLHEIAARLSRALPLPAAAQAALDAVVREAREEGYRSGFADGYEDGEKAARGEAE